MTRDDFGPHPDAQNYLSSPLPGCSGTGLARATDPEADPKPAPGRTAPYRALDGHVRTAPVDDGRADYDQATCITTCGACRDGRP